MFLTLPETLFRLFCGDKVLNSALRKGLWIHAREGRGIHWDQSGFAFTIWLWCKYFRWTD